MLPHHVAGGLVTRDPEDLTMLTMREVVIHQRR